MRVATRDACAVSCVIQTAPTAACATSASTSAVASPSHALVT